MILQDKESGVKIDNKTRRDIKFPVGIMDVVTISKTNEHYRMLYDVKGRFNLTKIKDTEAKFKLLKVTRKFVGPNKWPYIVTNDGRSIRFPHPEINVGDTLKYDLEKNTVLEWFKNEPGHIAFITGGNNVGRAAVIQHVERHLGGFDIVHFKDAQGKTFATRSGNVFVIGNKKSTITLPKGDGQQLSTLEEKAIKDERHRKPSAK
jgi:small subunit ribosomal protein S4e